MASDKNKSRFVSLSPTRKTKKYPEKAREEAEVVADGEVSS